MLKKICSVILPVTLTAIISCSGNDGIDLQKQVIQTDRETFTISMPQPPAKTVQELPTQAGNVRITMYFVNTGKTAFAVSCNDLPGKAEHNGPDKTLISGRDGFIQTTSGTLINDRGFKYGNIPAREYEVEAGNMVYFTRAYLAGNRLYQVMIAVEKENRNSGIIKKYLDSFSLTE